MDNLALGFSEAFLARFAGHPNPLDAILEHLYAQGPLDVDRLEALGLLPEAPFTRLVREAILNDPLRRSAQDVLLAHVGYLYYAPRAQ